MENILQQGIIYLPASQFGVFNSVALTSHASSFSRFSLILHSYRPPRLEFPTSVDLLFKHKYPQRLDYIFWMEPESEKSSLMESKQPDHTLVPYTFLGFVSHCPNWIAWRCRKGCPICGIREGVFAFERPLRDTNHTYLRRNQIWRRIIFDGKGVSRR